MPLEQFRTPRGQSVWLHIRENTNDHNTAFSCLNEDEYALPRVSGVAWDIGTYIGAVAIALALDNPDLRVVAIEPVPDNLVMASRNFMSAGIRKRVTLIAGAVGRGGEDVEIRYGFTGSEIATHHANVGNASIFDRDVAAERVTYQATSLSDLLDWYGIPSLVKIDTEGAEWAFLDTPHNAMLPLIVGEWHPTDGTLEEFAELLPAHDVTFTGPIEGPGGFTAVLRA